MRLLPKTGTFFGGSYSVRPSQGGGALMDVVLWPVLVGAIIGKTATKPDETDTP